MKRFATTMMVAIAFVATMSVAGAQEPCDPYTGGCPGSSIPPISTLRVLPSAGGPEGSSTSASLPLTGADIAGLVVLAAALVGGGILLVAFGRRRHSPDLKTT